MLIQPLRIGARPAKPSQSAQSSFRAIRKRMSIGSNQFCADCSDPCAVNVNLTHGTFVCANCAVVHRELGHAVKNSATDLFAPEEISALCASTNLAANRLWLARRGPGDCAIDPGANRLERRHFLECKYLLRQWFSEAGACAPLERPSESDFATDASDIGSPLPAMPDIEPGMGPMCEAERCRAASSPRQSRVSAAETFALCKSCARAPPVQIGERPPEKSWQTKQLPVRYQQRLWSVREKP